MPLQWDPQLMTGIDDVDKQHRQLIAIINGLEAAVESNAGSAVISDAVDQLNDYVLEHLATEESIMHSYGYPEIAKHILEHNHFKKKMVRFNFQPCKSEDASDDVLFFLKHWLVNHICTSDKSLGAFFRASFQA